MTSRLAALVRLWRVTVESVTRTKSCVLAFGMRDCQPVVLKVIRTKGDEWRSGAVLHAFGGRGVARVIEYTDGAVLMERLSPAISLAELVRNGSDEEATRILADVIASMSPQDRTACPAVDDWSRAYDSYLARDLTLGGIHLPRTLVSRAHELYLRLSASQRVKRLLHGDLHHYNVLLDARRGWLAIDPKGVIGETEFELGAALRNPYGRTEFFAPCVVERRLKQLSTELRIDENRALQWSFAQAVLAALWMIEDGLTVHAGTSPVVLANNILTLLGEPSE